MAILVEADNNAEERDQEDELAGEMIQYWMVGGYIARYQVVSSNPLKLVHVPAGELTGTLDAQRIATITVNEVRRKVKARKRAERMGWV